MISTVVFAKDAATSVDCIAAAICRSSSRAGMITEKIVLLGKNPNDSELNIRPEANPLIVYVLVIGELFMIGIKNT